MSNNFETTTETAPMHLRLYVAGNLREWVLAQASSGENSVSKWVTMLVKAEAKKAGVYDDR